MRTTNRTDGFKDITGVPEQNRDIVRRDGIWKRYSDGITSFKMRTGKNYLGDTTGGALTAYLPNMANDGAIASLTDPAGYWSLYNLTVDAQSNTIQYGLLAAAQTLTCDRDCVTVNFVYDRKNRLWRATYA